MKISWAHNKAHKIPENMTDKGISVCEATYGDIAAAETAKIINLYCDTNNAVKANE